VKSIENKRCFTVPSSSYGGAFRQSFAPGELPVPSKMPLKYGVFCMVQAKSPILARFFGIFRDFSAKTPKKDRNFAHRAVRRSWGGVAGASGAGVRIEANGG
jgi:hypothetical protein